MRRRHRGEIARLRAALGPIDLAMRNVRVVVRRAVVAVDDGEHPDPAVAASLQALADATDVLRRALMAGEPTDAAVSAFLDVAAQLPTSGGGFSCDVVVAQTRSTVTDLLTAAGMERDEARAAASATRGTSAGD
jgi:hypothetical protein